MKKKLLTILTLIMSFCLSLFVLTACDGCPGTIPVPSEKVVGLKFIDAPSSLIIGDVKKLTYVLGDEVDESTLQFESSNTNVATIDAKTATIEALNEGKTVITGKCDGYKAEFTLNVIKDDGLPQFLFTNYVDETTEQQVVLHDKLNLSGYVFYNSRSFDDGEITYSVDNPSLASITADGTFTALKAGKVTVSATASWRGMQSPLLKKEIVVNIINDLHILIADGAMTDIKLYTKAQHGEQDFATSFDVAENVKVTYNGADVTTNALFEITENEANAVSYDASAKTIYANKAGSAKLVVKVGEGENAVSQTVNVVCEKPLFEYGESVYFSQVDGEILELDDIFGDEVTLVEAYQNGDSKTGRKLTLDGNIVTDYQLQDINQKEKGEICVYTEDCGVLINVTAAYKIIRTPYDLTSVYGNSSTSKVEGYFLVVNDINAYKAAVEIKPTGCTGAATGSQFKGTFDGNGHKITYAVTQGGLFGYLPRGAVVKNASFVVKSVGTKAYASNAILAGYAAEMTIENVYATYDFEFKPDLSYASGSRTAGLGLFEGSNMCTLNNVVLDLSQVTLDGELGSAKVQNYGVLFAPSNSAWYYGSAVNTHVIWNEKALHFFTNGAKIAHAANDTLTTTSFGDKDYKVQLLTNVNRHDNYEGIKAYFAANPDKLSAFEGAVDISEGFPFGGSKASLVDTIGTIYYDGEFGDEAVYPAALKNKTVTSIVDIEDDTIVYYNGTTWSITQNTTNAAISYVALVYGENNTILGVVEIISATKVISKASDLTSVYGGSSDRITGYFVVANDIEYDASVVIKPTGTNNYGAGSQFRGVFDGNGYTIEYGLTRGGLFGNLRGTVKNASFRVKAVSAEGSTLDTDYGKYAILAGWMDGAIVDNVYATYDCEIMPKFEISTGTYRYRGLGLFGGSHFGTVSNTVVDLSNVKGMTKGTNYGYGVVLAPTSSSYSYGTTTNVYVIWGTKELTAYCPGSLSKIAYASNDTYTAIGSETVTKLTGVTRYDTLSDMANAVEEVGNFKITAEGITWNK